MSCEQCMIYSLKVKNLLSDVKRLEMEAYLQADKIKRAWLILNDPDTPPYMAVKKEIKEEQDRWTGEKK